MDTLITNISTLCEYARLVTKQKCFEAKVKTTVKGKEPPNNSLGVNSQEKNLEKISHGMLFSDYSQNVFHNKSTLAKRALH